METQIRALRTQLQKHADMATGYKSMLAPIRNVPPELLAEIFCRYREIVCATTTTDAALSRRMIPLHVSSICMLWRQVALSTPELWQNLDVKICINASDVQWKNTMTDVATRVHRAAAIGFTNVCVILDGHLDRSDIARRFQQISMNTRQKSFSRAIRPIASRIQTMTLMSADIAVDFDTFLSSADGLRNLNVDCRDWRRRQPYNLHPDDSNLLPGQWSQLSTLSLSFGIPVGHALKVLSLCANLVECNLRLVMDYIGPAQPGGSTVAPSQIVLPHLTRLVFNFYDTEQSRNGGPCVLFLDSITLPALKHLVLPVSAQALHSELITNALLQFRRRCQFDLESFHSGRIPHSAETLLQCLTGMPSLSHITLHASGSIGLPFQIKSFFNYLTIGHRNHDSLLAPKLSTFILEPVNTSTQYSVSIVESILDMVESRCAGGIFATMHATLGTNTVESEPVFKHIHEFQSRRLDMLSQMGVKLTFK